MREDQQPFHVSSFCTTGGCLGVARTAEGVELADVNDESAAPLRFTREEWEAFVAGVKNGEFDLS